MILDVLGAVLQPASAWFDSGCGAGPRARWLEGGKIEVEGEGTITKALPAAVSQWSSVIAAAADKHDLWPNFVAGFMATESGGQQHAYSSCCYGLMGLLPATASSMAGHSVTSDQLLNDPELNVDLGAKLISQLMTKYGGNAIKVATAYNAGGAYCTPAKGCNDVNRWGMRADCVKGVAVDYPGRVMSFSNAAAGVIVSGTAPTVRTSSGIWIVGGVALAIGTAIFLSR